MRLIDVYTEPAAPFVLYDLLKERTPEQSISHKRMPDLDEHCRFFESRPYVAWYLIEDNGRLVGSAYITKRREVGIFIFKDQHRKGYATLALAELRAKHPGNLLANINPMNAASIALFEGLGFKHIQNTYELRDAGP